MSYTDNQNSTISANSRLYYYSDNWQVLEEYDTTADRVTRCRVHLNIWMYNEMSEGSFEKFAKWPIFWGRPMASQFMWWNWKEYVKFK